MSNYSAVVLCWSGTDEAESHRSRMQKIRSAFAPPWTKWTVAWPCPDAEAIGLTCEFVAVAHWNHFDPDDLFKMLSDMPWERPKEVCVMWKDEEATTYSLRCL